MKDTDRRGFLKALAGGGALIATSQLPSFGKDDPTQFALRGCWEQLLVNYIRIDAGATKPFSVFHISDTHLTSAYPSESLNRQRLAEWRTRTFGGRQEEALRDSLKWAKEHVDYVLHTGDLIDWQSEANFDLLRDFFGQIPMACVGNHEFTPEMWLSDPQCTCDEAYKQLTDADLKKAYGGRDITFVSNVVNGVNFILIDDVYGTVTPEQVERFRAEAKKGLPLILCMHVPFYTDTIWLAHELFWKKSAGRYTNPTAPEARGDYARQLRDKTTRDFITYLKTEPLLKGILAGHLHIDVQDRFSPTATQYVVGGNFMFHGQQVLFA